LANLAAVLGDNISSEVLQRVVRTRLATLVSIPFIMSDGGFGITPDVQDISLVVAFGEKIISQNRETYSVDMPFLFTACKIGSSLSPEVDRSPATYLLCKLFRVYWCRVISAFALATQAAATSSNLELVDDQSTKQQAKRYWDMMEDFGLMAINELKIAVEFFKANRPCVDIGNMLMDHVHYNYICGISVFANPPKKSDVKKQGDRLPTYPTSTVVQQLGTF
jgi:hypothetical protein